MESQMYGTPVLGADIGGIPELIIVGQTGELFESGNKEELKSKIREMSSKQYKVDKVSFDTVDEYCQKLMKIYKKETKV